jgi:hypothetical protein
MSVRYLSDPELARLSSASPFNFDVAFGWALLLRVSAAILDRRIRRIAGRALHARQGERAHVRSPGDSLAAFNRAKWPPLCAPSLICTSSQSAELGSGGFI